MKYVKFTGENGYCGCDFEHYQAFEDDVGEETFEGMLEDMVHENAESFEHIVTGWDEDFEDEEERDAYYENCSGYWSYVSEEEWKEGGGD